MNNSFTPLEFASFEALAENLKIGLRDAPVVHPPRWQSMDVSKYDHMATHEMQHVTFSYWLRGREDLDYFRQDIKPNLPWADDHFLRERMSGQPINPGTTYKYWPPGMSASGSQHAQEHVREKQFDHSYAERYWPRFAGLTEGGRLDGEIEYTVLQSGHHGIRFRYGDVDDLVQVLAKERLTRQAYLPVWFPEDLAAANEGKRVPCSLGYHFLVRNDCIDVEYTIRSCDFVRHFRDDCYLTIRLLLWILKQVRLATDDEEWDNVRPGRLIMHIGSFHLFKADHRILFKERYGTPQPATTQPGVAPSSGGTVTQNDINSGPHAGLGTGPNDYLAGPE